MDDVRGAFDDLDGSPAGDAAAAFGADCAEDECDGEFVPVPIGSDERRMQVRAYNLWATLLGDHAFPAVDQLWDQALDEFGPYSVLMDFRAGAERPRIAYLGTRLARECDAWVEVACLTEVNARSLVTRIAEHYPRILENQAPVAFEAEFHNQREARILYRGVLLPFSSDGARIDFVYGVINWKELAGREVCDALERQIGEIRAAAASGRAPAGTASDFPASSALPRPRPPLPAVEGWADGPLELTAEMQLDDPAPATDGAASASAAGVGTGLAERLARARDEAEAASRCDQRSHAALYTALGHAWDFARAADAAPGQLAGLLAEAGIAAAPGKHRKASDAPLVRLVFGSTYDKTRRAEFAAVLGHARRLDMAEGALGAFLAGHPGGLKGVVAAEREARRGQKGEQVDAARARVRIEQKLRGLPGRPLESLACGEIGGEDAGRGAAGAPEFSLALVRRDAAGRVVVLGELPAETPVLRRAARTFAG